MNLNEFAPWQCPLCGAPLAGDVSLKCARNHSFDRAKEGYWHLLPVQNTRTKAPGDSREMVAARRAFLSAGYYGIFGQALGELCLEYGQPKAGKPLRLLDAGCGEGWYDRCIAKQFEEAGRPLELAGFDIAKPAVRLAAKALPSARYAVASSFHQPVRTGHGEEVEELPQEDGHDLPQHRDDVGKDLQPTCAEVLSLQAYNPTDNDRIYALSAISPHLFFPGTI